MSSKTGAPLKVGFIIGSLHRGGTETHLSEVMIELKLRGHDVAVFVVGPHGKVADFLAEHGIFPTPRKPVELPSSMPVWPRRILRMLLLGGPLYRFAWQHRKGIIQIFLPETVVGCGMMLQPWRRRMILSQRGMMTYRARYPTIFSRLERFVLSRGAFVLANSIPVRDELVSDGVPADKIRVLHNGLPERRLSVSETRIEMRQKLQIDEEAFVFAKLANLHVYKGYEDVIEAFALLDARNSLPENWLFLCIGGELGAGDAQQNQQASRVIALQSRADELGIGHHVRFLGTREDAPAILKAADVGIHASHEEGFSNAILEMMGASLPIVVTDVGGAREALLAGGREAPINGSYQAGVIVPRRNPIALARALEQLIDDPDLRTQMCFAARTRVMENFSIRKCVDNYEKIYTSVNNR